MMIKKLLRKIWIRKQLSNFEKHRQWIKNLESAKNKMNDIARGKQWII